MVNVVLIWTVKRLCRMIDNSIANDFDFNLTITGRRGLGKCLTKGSKVLMSNGEWKNIEEIKIGDEIISPQKDGSSNYEKVIEIHNKFEPNIYEVKEMTRKKRLLYTCAYNHQIPIMRVYSQRMKDNKDKRISKHILDCYEAERLSKLYNKNSKICSFTTSMVDYKNNKDSSIEPYVLGVYLGDGSFSSKLNKDKQKIRQLNISNSKSEILSYISEKYPIMNIYFRDSKTNKKSTMIRFSLNGEFAKELERLGLEGKGSGEKFIPKECLLSSMDYRLKLLAGIIDTDGCVYKNCENHIEVITKSERFANDIKDLVFSLGEYSSIKQITKKCQNNFIGNYFNIKISFENPKIIPLLSEKKNRLGNKMKNNPRHIAINVVKKDVGEMVYGFSISGDSKWFVTDNWMITHNSTLGIKIAKGITFGKFSMGKDLLYTKEDIVKALSTRKKRIILGDEIVQTAFNRDFYSEYNKTLIKTLTMYRDSCNLFISCIPNFSMLDNQFRSLVKMRIDVVKRGVGIIHVPIKSQYTRDIWDVSNNEKVEKEWLSKGMLAKPKYTKLSTFVGIVKFNDLPPATRKQYLRIKNKKRNAIYEQMVADSGEKEQQQEGVTLQDKPLDKLELMLVNRQIKDKKHFDEMCKILNLKPTSTHKKISDSLRNKFKPNRLSEYFFEPNKPNQLVTN
jgi:intein/homing endonuclease